jgi:glutaredoxin
MTPRLIVGLCAVLVTGLVLAQTQYRWVDEKGRVQYTDTPPPPSAKDVKKKSAVAPPAGTPVVPYDLEKAQKESPVTLYTHPTCTETCQVARDVLNKRGVPFKETVVVSNKDLEDLKTLTGNNQVPVLLVGSKMEKVPSEAAYNAMLDSAGYPKAGVLPQRKQAAPAVKQDELQTSGPEGEKPPAKAETPATALGPYAPGAKPAPKPATKPPASTDRK